MSGSGARLRRAAYREWGALVADLRIAFVRTGWRAVPLTLVSVLLISVLQLVQHTAWGDDLVNRAGVVSASLLWWKALLRTPLSLFVPALDLPMWGALAQVLVVFGIAEATLGKARTLGIAYAATLAGTTYARWGVSRGPHAFLGLEPIDAFIRDTGPSAAVVALAVCIAWRYRAWWTAGTVIGSMALEVVLWPNLAGWEHLAAIAAAVGWCLVDDALRRRRKRRTDRPAVAL
ncbi:hypothetical protein ACFOSC_21135 [Streptantibioticus rubrisoli]|uniref:Integral membrane protein n=1 Tax=Streptantibioticus rubrisoli TaxID=1387313 RepID=A0ABT1PPQ0_9ACTN|nr:hypothetical protein [Streptantibioticus rubrisoli]MCQ4046215.1 hypothetical protein [Streptantibioticus rubrisoli]